MDETLFQATLWTDGILPASEFQLSTVDFLQHLSPWGQKFPSPVFEGEFQVVDYRWLKETHLKLQLVLENGQGVDAIAFGAAEKYQFDAMNSKVRLVYELDKNTFNGHTRLQLRVLHLEQ